MIQKVRNPSTGRWITVNGPTFNKLKAEGQFIDMKQKRKVKQFVPTTQYDVPKQFKKYPVDRSETPWGLKKPDRKNDRKTIYDKCGSSCFLMKKDDKLNFPVCNKDLPCTYNCRGIKAASSRAGEWKYEKVLQTSKKLTRDLGCYKDKKK